MIANNILLSRLGERGQKLKLRCKLTLVCYPLSAFVAEEYSIESYPNVARSAYQRQSFSRKNVETVWKRVNYTLQADATLEQIFRKACFHRK